MNNIIKLILGLFLLGILSCDKGNEEKFHLDSVDSKNYYSQEFLTIDSRKLYGKWKLFNVSGGFSGAGYEPDYDYLEIKSIGIYGLVRNNQLIEYGKIELDTFDHRTNDLLQIRLIPDDVEQDPTMHPPEKYIDFKGNDSLDLFSPCCDMYNYHYIRIN